MTNGAREFLRTIREAEGNGVIKTSVPLSDFDIMVQYAIGMLYDEGKTAITTEEICKAMIKYCGEDVFLQ